MHFSNYNDDRAKNHRIYSAEILWRFYEKTQSASPRRPWPWPRSIPCRR